VLIERFQESLREREREVGASKKKRRGKAINVKINRFENEIKVIKRRVII
jgi:hypothetical protein